MNTAPLDHIPPAQRNLDEQILAVLQLPTGGRRRAEGECYCRCCAITLDA